MPRQLQKTHWGPGWGPGAMGVDPMLVAREELAPVIGGIKVR